MMVPVEGTEAELPCELVLIAAGFLGSQKYVTDAFGVELTERTNERRQQMDLKQVYRVYLQQEICIQDSHSL